MKRPLVTLAGMALALAVAIACTSAGPTPTSTPSPTASPTVSPTTTPTPLPTQEWDLEGTRVDGSTVTVSLTVFAGIDVWATLDDRRADEVKPNLPTVEYVFQNVTPGRHTIAVQDVVGYSEATEVVVLPLTSTSTPTPTPTATPGPGATLTEESFRKLLTTEDAEGFMTAGELLKTEFFDYRQLAASVDPAQVTSMDSWYGLSFQTEDGMKGLTFSVIDFDSQASAQDNFEMMTAEAAGPKLMGSPIGDASAEVEVNAQGIGSMLVFMTGDRLVQLHTAQPDGERPLVSLEGLEGLAEIVAVRLSLPENGAQGEIPRWLSELIQGMENAPVAIPPASITQYEYQGQTVYFLPQRCCDIYSNLYDADGNIISHPDGGITGQGDGRLPDFFGVRSNDQTIWEDQRTQDPGMVHVPAPIESVEIVVMESFPPQYALHVVSGLPNGCMAFEGYTVTRGGETIRVDVVNVKPADESIQCTEEYRIVEHNIPLGSDFETGETYTVMVNDVTETFVAQ